MQIDTDGNRISDNVITSGTDGILLVEDDRNLFEGNQIGQQSPASSWPRSATSCGTTSSWATRSRSLDAFPGGSIHDAERRTIEDALQRHGGEIRAAARDLGITRTTLYRKIRRHGIPVEEDRGPGGD
jgi:parallel beta-helix repeat protein